MFVGVNDDGIPVGLQNARKLKEELPNKIRDTMGVIVNINLHHRPTKIISKSRFSHILSGDLVVDDVVETLALISVDPGITTKEIGLKLSISQRRAQRILQKLKSSKKIERVGSDRKAIGK